MKKNLYYRTTFKRTNRIKEYFIDLFIAISSLPRLILEVFLRKNFGERYFSFGTCIFIALVMFFIPLTKGFGLINVRQMNWNLFIGQYWTWYVFIAAFIYFSVKRRNEVKRNPSVFDFKRFSLYAGDINPFFNKTIFGVKPDARRIETYYEPSLCLIIGDILFLFTPMTPLLSILITWCSIFYCLCYAGAYYKGDHFVMDKIDEILCTEELFSSFVEGRDPSETKGVRFYGPRPADPDIRRKVFEGFFEEEETFEAV